MFFFFKQKTAYDMLISDWSSDVCSSDLLYAAARGDNEPWQSQSALSRPLPLDTQLPPGVQRFDGPLKITDSNGRVVKVYHFAMGLIWDQDSGASHDDIALTFHVFEDASVLNEQLSDRKSTRLNSSH